MRVAFATPDLGPPVVLRPRAAKRNARAFWIIIISSVLFCLSAAGADGLRLDVTVFESPEAIVARSCRPQTITIRVVDTARRPIRGATVVFSLPAQRPTGTFANGYRIQFTRTDEDGVAHAMGLMFEPTPGTSCVRIDVHQSASVGRSDLCIDLPPIRVPGRACIKVSRPIRGRTVRLLAIIGSAALAAALVNSRRSKEQTSSTPAVGITIGPPVTTIGKP